MLLGKNTKINCHKKPTEYSNQLQNQINVSSTVLFFYQNRASLNPKLGVGLAYVPAILRDDRQTLFAKTCYGNSNFIKILVATKIFVQRICPPFLLHTQAMHKGGEEVFFFTSLERRIYVARKGGQNRNTIMIRKKIMLSEFGRVHMSKFENYFTM